MTDEFTNRMKTLVAAMTDIMGAVLKLGKDLEAYEAAERLRKAAMVAHLPEGWTPPVLKVVTPDE